MTNNKKEGAQFESQGNNNSTNNENSNPTVEIEIKRHQQLFELLTKPMRMWRVLLSLFLIIVVLFLGIAFVIIAIKKYYPYSVIETNIQGATTMKTEDKEVIYWLFNTADLWANSGIEVKEGDELTIRASGASFTAIHHLVKASDENFKPIDEWVGTGGQRKDEERDRLRAEYRINKNYNEGILLMQIIPADKANMNGNWKDMDPCYLRDGNIEIIGKERRNLRISQNGVLHFAVNDVVLPDHVLDSMYVNWIKSLIEEQFIDSIKTKSIFELINKRNDISKVTFLSRLSELNNTIFNDSIKRIIEKKNIGLALGHYPPKGKDSSYYKAYPLINELVYYKEKQFRDAWYVDNLGSFLIVIERKKQ